MQHRPFLSSFAILTCLSACSPSVEGVESDARRRWARDAAPRRSDGGPPRAGDDAATPPSVLDAGGRTAPDAATADARVARDAAVVVPPDAPVEPADCASSSVLCVGGPSSEHATIAGAVGEASGGDIVLVHAGTYAGFQVDTSGTAGSPLIVRALPGVVIDRDGPTGDGIRLQNVSHVTIEGFTIVEPSQRCIAARGATADDPMVGNVVRGNRCEGSGVEGFYLSQFADALIEGNSITRTGQAGGSRDHGIYLANAGSDRTILRGNVITETPTSESAGIHMNGDASIGGDGMISGLLIEGNVISGTAHNALNMDGVETSRVVGNLVYGTERHALRGYAIDGSEGPQGLVIVNNTFVVSGSGFGVRLTEDRGGHVIFNNILIGGSGGGGSISLESPSRATLGENATVDGTGTLTATLALFRDAASGDFELASGSAAIDRGTTSLAGHDAPETDLRGRARSGAPDLGALEAVP